MSNLPVKTLLKEIDNLSREEKIQLIHYLTRQIEKEDPKTESENLVELFQNSPLFGVDIDLERQRELDNRQVEL
ncbi:MULTISPECIES: hypothetical protein [unclassified Tolypothrix]|uniref:hypothetical protein n=1 Tax=unclassified Tolypothrix TaxID=2649714 RepID=UPI0005EAA523|nr:MULTISPECIES: hypothetical protein [unclassified Tolypothrix]BAY90730.1 hypothetical protein NIES3275_27470 [Microchaete diplosiphon NIES-3275]EKF04441.1 hypothetical protein FDUTEX481_02121 [Tolypothrix sp. PCC 7601]MBE9081064.1 hypothetical protein [Tolypothrix sp. LEGE 11397]UYD24871.1 hypothetical protein HGR01_26135 [Tolypothrix sp. PCC 7712]UYD32897.1 hypothetical protein HG267_28500 [Tolypothrix sp. PCC 7601]